MASYESIMEAQSSLEAAVSRQFAEFQAALRSASPRSDTVESLSAELRKFQETTCAMLSFLRQQISALANSVDVIETRHRRKFLLFGGIAESRDEDVTALVASICQDHMLITEPDTPEPSARPARPDFKIVATGQEARNFDYAAARQSAGPVKTTNFIESVGHLIKTCLGGGVVGIHEAYKKCGLITALVINIVAGLLLIHSKYILVTSAQLMYGRLNMPCLSYPDLAEAVLKMGQFPKLTKFANLFRYMVDATICINLFGSCCVYSVIIARSVKQVMEEAGAIEVYSIRYYIACMLIPCVLIAMILSLKYLAPFSIFGNILLLILAGATIYYGSKHADKSPLDFPLIKGVEGFFMFLGVCVFSMEGMGVVLAIENHMTKPKQFPAVLCLGMSAVIGVVAIIGFFGYWGFGEKAYTPITNNFPWEPFPIILKCSLAVVVYVTFGLNLWSPFNVVWHYIKVKHNPKNYWCVERVYRAIIVVGLILLAIAFPNINAFMGFLGSFCISLMGFLYPAFIEIVVKWEDPGLGPGKWRLYKDVLVIIFGVFLCVLGTYSNVKELIQTAG